ncbi:MAG: secretion protein [Sphingomonas sp. SCN 67-18]|uniref:HlyD family efflux transporter periplasmic adaptor subunit n=1 Tax=uncultured Sphingomonas sp. TaxID=158754 RepID=UPI00086CF7D7|nr:HlyD family efflux transporter periplasmic adaptor subunit [Sphingomonas sp. SCN 67-18]ODU20665.1 MAG: secretion protein [Sphingomonas sp. SCN 67-18]
MRRRQIGDQRAPAIIIALSTLAVVGFILWALWAELDQIARAHGQVIPSGRVQVVQSADGGVISRILVREGDRVKRGQLLVVLEKVSINASVDESAARVAGLKAQLARIEAELFDRPLRFPSDVAGYPEFVNNQRMLYAKRRQSLNSELQSLRHSLGLAQEEMNMTRPLVASGDVSRADVLRMQRSASEIQSQITSRRNAYLQELQAEFTRTEEELVSAQQMLTQRAEGLGNTDLRAPADGIVKNVRLTTVGAVLQPGGEALQIVPTGDALIVEAQISPSDIAFVHVGQTASVRFDAYDSSIYGSGTGRVTFVSPDTLSDDRPGGPPATYYRAHLSVDTGKMRPRQPGETIIIQPGMTATVEIKTGSSTVFRYLTKPILKTTAEAMSER